MNSGTGLATEYAPPLDLPFRFMATALAWFAILAGAYPWHMPLLLGGFYDSHLLTFVHVNTLGVIAATIFGASYQMLPVVLGAPIASVRMARLSWWLYLPALPLFLAGLSQGWLVPLALGATLLYTSIALYAGVVVRTLRSAPYRDVVFWHLAASIVGLVVGASLGVLLALSKHVGFLGGLTLPILAAHATLMLGGWVAPLLMGVAFRLVGMFTLTEDHVRPAWAWVSLISTASGAWLLAAALLIQQHGLATMGAATLLVGVAIFGVHLLHLYRARRRRQFDVHVPFVLSAVAFGLLAVGLTLFGLLSNRSPTDGLWIAAAWLAIAGWAQTPIQGFLYKIGTFLTWLHRYAPLAGRQPVPRLEAMYDRGLAVAGWLAWTLGVSFGAAAPLTHIDLLARLSAPCLSLGVVLFLTNAVRVGSHWRTAVAPSSTVPVTR
jgi:hypothetical protein